MSSHARTGLIAMALIAAVGACDSPSAAKATATAAPADAAPPPPRPIDAAPAPDALGALAGLVDRPMKWSDERARLMLAYRQTHSDPAATDLTIVPQMIVLHYTAGNSAKGTMGYFDNTRMEAERTTLKQGGDVNVSAHFVVDRDGTIYQLQPVTRMARHCIGLNHVAIGVENVGDDEKWPLTDAQVDANARLVRWLAAQHPITHLIGHHEAMAMRDHPLFVELVAGYKNSKPDPGAAFMTKVRARLDDLALQGPD